MHADTSIDAQPVVARLEDFDTRSGSRAERALFNHRPWVMLLCLLAHAAARLAGHPSCSSNASFEKTIPDAAPVHRQLPGQQGQPVRAGQRDAHRRRGDAGQRSSTRTTSTPCSKLNDEIYLLPGVDRPFMKSLWTSNTRWVAVTEEGLDGNTVMGDSYDGSPAALAEVRANVERSGEIGQLVAARLQVEHRLRAAAGQEPQDRRGARLRRARPPDRGAARQVRERARAASTSPASPR